MIKQEGDSFQVGGRTPPKVRLPSLMNFQVILCSKAKDPGIWTSWSNIELYNSFNLTYLLVVLGPTRFDQILRVSWRVSHAPWSRERTEHRADRQNERPKLNGLQSKRRIRQVFLLPGGFPANWSTNR